MKRLVISLALALMMVAVMAMPVMAADDTTSVEGTLGATIEVTAPVAQTLPALVPDAPVELASPCTVTVESTVAGWTLGVKDGRGLPISAGHMDNGTTTALTNPLQVKGGGQAAYTDLSASYVMLTPASPAAGTTNIADVNFQQTATYADAADTYTIIVTFTATLP